MAIYCLGCNAESVKEIVKENRRYFYCENCKQVYDRSIDSAYGRELDNKDQSKVIHTCVGALIREGNSYLLLKRRAFPFGYGLPAGHVEYGEDLKVALAREVSEETGLTIQNCKEVWHGEVPGSKCRYGADRHIWSYFTCVATGGRPILNPESELIGWYDQKDILSLDLIASARFIFSKILLKQ